MNFLVEHWEGLCSLVLSVVAIAIAISASRKTSKDATRQIESIKTLAKLQIETSIKQVEIEIDRSQMQMELAQQEIAEMDDINNSGLANRVDFREEMVREFNERRPERIYHVYEKHTQTMSAILESLKEIKL